jgi:hypothetical protein
LPGAASCCRHAFLGNPLAELSLEDDMHPIVDDVGVPLRLVSVWKALSEVSLASPKVV